MKLDSLLKFSACLLLCGTALNAQPFTVSNSVVNIALAPGFNHAMIPVGITPVGPGFDYLTMQASSDAGWVTPTVDAASGSLLLTFATEAMTGASYTATITATHGADSQMFSVSAAGAALSVFKLIDDPFRSRTYGISQQGLNRGSVLVLDPIAGTLLSNVTVGRKPTGLAVSNDGSELFVINSVDETISVVDLNSLSLKETINVSASFDNWGQSSTTANIGVGADDILYYIDAAWAPALRVFKRSTGVVLQTMFIDGNTGRGVGDFALNEAKTALYGWAQYGWSAGWTGSYVSKFDVSASGTLTLVQSTSSTYPTPLSRDPLETPVLIPNNGQSVFVKKWSVDSGTITTVNRSFSTEVYSISPGGEVAVTASSIFETATGNLLYTLPFSTTVQAVTSDYARLVLFNGTTRAFQFVDLFSAVGAEALGRTLTPANGAVVLSPSALQWSPTAGADSYRVFLGTSAVTVAAADTSSSEYLGQTMGSTFALAALTPGTTYYWRADAVSSLSGVTPGSVFSFTVSALSMSPTVIVASTVRGHADLTQSVALDAVAPGTSWQAVADQSWVSLTSSSGTTPGTLEVVMDASALELGLHSATITLSNAGGVLATLPVTLTVEPLKLTQLRSDPLSGFVYAISEDTTAASPKAYLLEIDSTLKKITRVLPVGSSATDLAIHNPEGRIYVPNWRPGSLLSIDKATMSLVRTYAFNPFQGTGYGQGDVYRIAAGAAGRLIVEDQDQWIDVNLMNTSSGSILATTFQRQGGGAFDPTGRYYFHGDDNSSGAEIRKFDTAGDLFTALSHVRVSSYNYYGSRTVVVSESGNAVFWNGSHFNSDLIEQWTMSAEVYGTTPNGRYAFGETKIFDTISQQQVLGMPATTRVSAFNSTSGQLVAEVGQSVKFFAIGSPLTLPEPVLASGQVTATSVVLSWLDNSLETAFTLQYRTQGNANWTDAAAPTQNATAATIGTLLENTTYEFRIKADSPVVSSVWSNVVTVTTPIVPPATPVLYTPTATPTQVNLAWTDSDKEDSFVVERRLVGETAWSVVGTVVQNVLTYVDLTVASEVSYEYRLKAVLGSVESAYSSIMVVITPAPSPPATPSGVALVTLSSSQLRITWNNVLDETGYVIERRTADPLSWQEVAVVAADLLVFDDTTVTAGIRYWYRVSAVNAVGASIASVEVTGIPADLTCIAQDSFNLGLNSAVWSSVTGGAPTNGGLGFLGSNALWFGGTGTRAATTVSLNIQQAGVVEFKIRGGNQTIDGNTYWNNSESGESVVLEYSLDGVIWTAMESINTVYPYHFSWMPHSVPVPPAAISANTRFRWRQLAHSGSALDTWALEDVCVFSAPPPPPLAPPFIISSPNSATAIAISWAASADTVSYIVERTLNGSSWAQIATTPAVQTYYTDIGLSPATWYQYRIRASNLGGTSPPSSTSLTATLSHLAEWRLANYGTTSPTGASSSDATGHDGIMNLAKFAFNMGNSDGFMYVQPGGGTKGLPTTLIDPVTRRLRVEFIRRKASSDPGIEYYVEFCHDMSCFTLGGSAVQVTSIDALLERVVWEDSVSIDDASSRFVRVKVVEQP